MKRKNRRPVEFYCTGISRDNVDIDGGTIDNTVIGETTPVAGNFTTGDFIGDVDIDGVLTSIVDSWYGVRWPGATSACERTGALLGVAASSSPGNSKLPIHSTIRRCVLDDDGEVVYYLDPDNSYNREGHEPSITGTDDAGAASKVSDAGVFTLDASAYVGKYVHNITDSTYSPITAKDSDNVLSIADDIMANGETFEICTAGICDGGDGQVMVQIRAFHYRFTVDGDGYPNWDIGFEPFEGSSIHPAFYMNGEFVPYRYMSAFEGSMYKQSIAGMVAPADIITGYTIAEGDKLCSLAGEFPKVNETRDDYRNMSSRRSIAWRQQDFDLMSAVQLLHLVEYADFDSQTMIGVGRTELSGGSYTADSYIGKCGKSLGDGNGTNSVGGNTNAAYMTYRGCENFFGNIWKFLDGININNRNPYVCNNDADFQDDTETGYTDLGVTMPVTNNYQQTLHLQGRGLLPATIGADTGKITDYYWQAAGWRVVSLGGAAENTTRAGIFTFLAQDDFTFDDVASGGRLAR